MSAFPQANAPRFRFKVGATEMMVVDFSLREQISVPFVANLTLASADEVQFEDVVGKIALLTLESGQTDRYVHGIVDKFIQTGGSGRFYLYQARLTPQIKLLSLEQDCRIFQQKSVPDIVKEVLKDSGITGDQYDFRLQGTYAPRDYCVQYRETDLNFISRLLEDEGIFYFFEHSDQTHLMVFGDGTVNYKPISGQANMVFNAGAGMVAEEEAVVSFHLSRQIRSGKYTTRDFNFERPSLNMTADKTDQENTKLEVYDYPGEYALPEDGRKIAQVRLQQAVMYKDKAEGSSVSPRFMPGFTFSLTGHAMDAFNREYLLVEVTHTGSQPQVLAESASSGKGTSYENEFLAIPSSVIVRPEKMAHKTVVEGVQTAIVTGPDGEEIYTDKHGRVKVQFHWDRLGQNDDKSSCWIRVSQVWAGSGWGAMHIPRIGQEVVVDFIEGDADRPIITGRVYHGTNTPPYSLPGEKTKSTLKSNSTIGGSGSNEIRFEDKKGSEEIYIHGQKDWTIAIENNKNQSVGANETLTVGSNRTKRVGVDQSESIGSNKTIVVGGSHSENIGANMSLIVGSSKTEMVGAASAETVGAAKAVTIGAGYQITVGGALNETVGGAKAEQVGAAKSLMIGGPMSLSVGSSVIENIGGKHSSDVSGEYSLKAKRVQVTAADEIVFKTGSAQITLKKSGDIIIKGKNITVKGSSDVTIKGSTIKEN